MGRSSKSKRFVQQGKDVVARHAEKIPYHTTLAEAEQRQARPIMTTETNGGL